MFLNPSLICNLVAIIIPFYLILCKGMEEFQISILLRKNPVGVAYSDRLGFIYFSSTISYSPSVRFDTSAQSRCSRFVKEIERDDPSGSLISTVGILELVGHSN